MNDLAKQIAEQTADQARRAIVLINNNADRTNAAERFRSYTDAEFDTVLLLVKRRMLSDADGAKIAMFLDQMTEYVKQQCC